MNIYTEYAKIRVQLSELQEKQKELEEKILGEVKNLTAPMKTEVGTFTTVMRKSFIYSDDVKTLEKQIGDEIKGLTAPLLQKVEEKKLEELKSGVAQVTETVGLRFIAPKPSN